MSSFIVFFWIYLILLLEALNVFAFTGIDGLQIYFRHKAKLLGKLKSEDIEKYKRIQQLVKLKEQGFTYAQIKEMASNGTVSVSMKKGPRRTFEQRLRTIVGIKGESLSSKVSSPTISNGRSKELRIDDEDLQKVMNDDSYDDEIPYDEEETLYEQIVLEIMEEESLKEIEDNFVIQKDLERIRSQTQNFTLSNEQPISNAPDITAAVNISDSSSSEDLYVPKVSTWGIFPRPKNMSQAYGGGRVINSYEVELELSKSSNTDETIPTTQSKLQKEFTYKTEIQEALKRSRTCMLRGYPKDAIEALEEVKDYLVWETEFSGEVWLELGMAYETLYQLDDARAIYNKILATNWSQKNRKNASLLLSGLDIAKKVSKKLAEGQEDAAKAFNSFSNSDVFNEVMDKAVYSSWDSYKRNDRRSRGRSSSYEIDKSVAQRLANYSYNTVEEAYLALLIEIQPLQEVKTEILVKAIKKLNSANESEKYEFIGSKEYRFRDDQSFQLNSIISALKSTNQQQALVQEREKAKQRFNYQVQNAIDLVPFINGSWELVTSLSLPFSTPFSLNQRKRYELGENRRYLNIYDEGCSEVFPSFFGLSTSSLSYSCKFNEIVNDIIFKGESLGKSTSPWMQKKLTEQRVKLIYCDDIMMVTKQLSSGNNKPKELYTIWKRLQDNLYRKY
eukprot:gene10811-11785_t